ADFVRSLGAHEVVSYAARGWTDRVKELTGGRGVDVALEMTGGPMFGQTLSVLAPFGRLVVYGTASREQPTLEAARLIPYNHTIAGYYVAAWFAQRPQAAALALTQVIDLIARGKVDVQVGKVLPLAAASEAHRLLETRATFGKIVLK